MFIIILYLKIISHLIKYIFSIVFLHFRKHIVLHGKISTLQIIVREDVKLRMLLLLTTIALVTATFIQKEMQFFEKTMIKIL